MAYPERCPLQSFPRDPLARLKSSRMPVVGKPVWNMKLLFARSGADRLDAVEGLDGGGTGRSAAGLPGSRDLVFTGSESARAVATKPCPNVPPINMNIKIKRIARDSFK